jgi:hypothetical protein
VYDDNDSSEQESFDYSLHLLKTKLRVNGEELQRLNKDGGPVLRLPLHAIRSIEVRKKFDAICLVFIGMGVAAAAIGALISENNVLTIILYVVGVLFVGFGLLGAMALQITIRTDDDEVTTVQCSDMSDEAECFVTSVRHIVRMMKKS